MKITTPHTADLAGLPLEATVAMSDVAGAMREGPMFLIGERLGGDAVGVVSVGSSWL